MNQIEEAFRKKGIKGSEEKPAQGAAKQGSQDAARQGSQGASKPAVRTAPGPAQTTSHAGSSAWLPEDYVAEAERNMRALGTEDTRTGRYSFKITTSKIRNILSMVSDIYNDELLSVSPELSEKSKAKKKALQVRILYEAGRNEVYRERPVEEFVLKTKLLDYLKQVENNRAKFIEFAKYMEALVAYHLYLGGRDN